MMNPKQQLQHWLDECPLVAIIRGVTAEEAEAVGAAIYEGGIRMIEVPLNSPRPFDSIERIARLLGDQALVGAGTVLDPEDVRRVKDIGGGLIVSPNTYSPVINAAFESGMVSMPGFFTPSEGFEAIRAGATGLKLFPAEAASPKVVSAQLAVLPRDVPLLVVGGIAPDNMRPWLDAGAVGFGLGSGLYKPGRSAAETGDRARAYVQGLKS
jgi:2-dehydro-3-deoxyphosphogalactonate aldolase